MLNSGTTDKAIVPDFPGGFDERTALGIHDSISDHLMDCKTDKFPRCVFFSTVGYASFFLYRPITLINKVKVV
ncbi:MAG: hypothetical protein JXR76_12480 [Deltaproteobacteria bacterium]|nr:hypothetical protein [Deltaproteobacteria bacterium]